MLQFGMLSLDTDQYRPAPFWFLNHELDRQELERQIKMMKQAGVSGFFMHPRSGLKVPYGSKKWFQTIRFISETAAKCGLKAWLYDDDPFPSGIAGGKVIFQHPEFRAYSLLLKRSRPDGDGGVSLELGTGRILSAVAIKRDHDGGIGKIIDLKDDIGILREHYFAAEIDSSYYATMYGRCSYRHPRAETYNAEQILKCNIGSPDWEVFTATAAIVPDGDKHRYRSDNLNPESVRFFIENTHGEYLKHCGEYFGSFVPGVFTDEPAAGGVLPWTTGLEERFYELKGYDLKDNYFHLNADLGAISAEIREDYWEVLNRLYIDSYYKQVSDWCHEHGLLTAGHILCEEDPIWQVYSGGNVYAYQKYFDIPGFDVVTTNIGNSRFPVLSFGGKLISSAAHQQGKNLVLSECFACAPWNFGKESMLKTANWLFALGITWLVPHGFFYSIDGFRKRDAGKAFSFQDPCYGDFPWFAEYAARLGSILGEAKHQSRTAVLYQVSSFWSLLPAREDLAEQLRDHLYSVTQALISSHIEFDFIDETTLLTSPISDGNLICGDEMYTCVVIPFPENMGRNGKQCLDRLRDCSVNAVMADSDAFIAELKQSGALWTRIEALDSDSRPDELMVLRKQLQGNDIAYVFNNSPAPGRFRMGVDEDKSVYVLDAGTGDQLAVPLDQGWLEFGLNGYQSILMFQTDTECPSERNYEMPDKPEAAVLPAESDPQWEYPLPEGGCCTIQDWDIEIEGTGITKQFKDHPYCLIRDILGTELSYILDKAVRPFPDQAPVVSSRYPVKAQFTAEFEIEASSADRKLVFENDTFAGQAFIAINGRELALADARRELVYDPLNLVLDLNGAARQGRNTISISFPEARESDGLRSALYIV